MTRLAYRRIFTILFFFSLLHLQSCKKPDTIDVGEVLVADFTYELNENELVITNRSSNYTKLEWHFGDGEVSYEESPVHLYQISGDVTLKLIAHDQGVTREKTEFLFINLPKSGPSITKVEPSVTQAKIAFEFGDYSSDKSEFYVEIAHDLEFNNLVMGKIGNVQPIQDFPITDSRSAKWGIVVAHLLPNTPHFVRIKGVYTSDTVPEPIIKYSNPAEFWTTPLTKPIVDYKLAGHSHERYWTFTASIEGDTYREFAFSGYFVLDTNSMKRIYPKQHENYPNTSTYDYMNTKFYYVCQGKLNWDSTVVSRPTFYPVGTGRAFWAQLQYPFSYAEGTDAKVHIDKMGEDKYHIRLQISENEQITLNLLDKVDGEYHFKANSNSKTENHMLYYKNNYEHLSRPDSDFGLIVEQLEGTDYTYAHVDFQNNGLYRVIFQNLKVENYQSVKELAFRLE